MSKTHSNQEKSFSAPSSQIDSQARRLERDRGKHPLDQKSIIYELRDCVMTVTNLDNGKFCSCFATKERLIVSLNHILDHRLDARLVLTVNINKVATVVSVTLQGVDWALGLMTLTCDPEVKLSTLLWEDIYEYAEGNQVICIGSGQIGEGLIIITYISKIRAVDPDGVVPSEVMFLGQNVLVGSVVWSSKGFLGLVVGSRDCYAMALTEKSLRGVKAFSRLLREPDCGKYPQITRAPVPRESSDVPSPWIWHKYAIGVYGHPVRATDRTTLIGYLVTESHREQLAPGTIVTHIDGTPIGDRIGQTIGSLPLWNKTGPVEVKLTLGDGEEQVIKLIPYPPAMDTYSSRKYCL